MLNYLRNGSQSHIRCKLFLLYSCYIISLIIKVSHFRQTFFADLPIVGGSMKVDINQGDGLFMPAGYIHFVYTHEDSIAIGMCLLVV